MRPTENKAPSYLQDEDGFARLIDDWGDRLLRLCTLYLGDVHLAEDAVQETLLKAWRNADRFRGAGSELTWITRIAINVCKSYLRSPWKRRCAPADELDTLFADTGDPQVDDTLPRAILALSRPCLLYTSRSSCCRSPRLRTPRRRFRATGSTRKATA